MSVGSLHARPKNDSAHRQARDEAHRHRDVGVAGDRRRAGAVAAVEAVAADVVGEPRRTGRRRHDRVEAVLVHERVDAVGARRPLDGRDRLPVLGRVERGRRLGDDQPLLAEERHLLVAVRLVEGDELGQALDRRAGAQALEVAG